ncbi:hypothetical protein [Streptomyces sediminimaris]|uniref:hypothetical protein n=1 Tax=Streptomyces sediminimaris TaxID=3383721 RepID=UPI00399B2581
MSALPEPPAAVDLTRAQYAGWACCWCGRSLLHVRGAVSAGTARGTVGAVVLDVDVYGCPPGEGCGPYRDR